MIIFYPAEREIISIKKAISDLGCDIDEFTQEIINTSASLIILPDTSIAISIRFPNKYQKTMYDRTGENPLKIDYSRVEGFIPSTSENKKIIHSLNWKTSNPIRVVNVNEKLTHAIICTPEEFATKEILNEQSVEEYWMFRQNNSWEFKSYKNQEFYFKNILAQHTQIKIHNIYILEAEFQEIKSIIINKLTPGFENYGDYNRNDWSNESILDINSLHYSLYNEGILSKIKSTYGERKWKKIIKSSMEQRWLGDKRITKQCLNHVADIVDKSWGLDINLEELDVSKNIYDRNQKGSTKALILIDIVAERHFNNKKGYRNSAEVYDTLKIAGVKTDTVRQAIYSFIKVKKGN